MEFTGDGIKNLSMADMIHNGKHGNRSRSFKNGIFPVDEKTEEYLKEHTKKEYKVYEADEDAEYESVVEIDLSEVRPTVAFPHLPGNAKTIDEIEAMETNQDPDQVVIGSLYKRKNGRYGEKQLPFFRDILFIRMYVLWSFQQHRKSTNSVSEKAFWKSS